MMNTMRFSELVDTYFHKILTLNPVWGSDLGLVEYDNLMPRGNRAHMEEYHALLRSFLKDVKEFPTAGFTLEEVIDRDSLMYALDLDLFRTTSLEKWRSYPTGPDSIGSAFYTLISRDYPSFEERLKSIIARMEMVPSYLAETRELLDRPVWIWVEIGIESCHRMKGYLDFIQEMAHSLVTDKDLLDDLHAKSAVAEKAIKEFEHWLYNDVLPRSKSEFAAGEEKFDRLLEKRMLGLSRKEILAIGEDYVESINATIRTLAGKIDSASSVDTILKDIRKNRPSNFEAVLEHVKGLMHEAREFVRTSGYATVPAEETLEVQETPIFMRHFIPFAAYSSPGRFDRMQKGIYMITPVEGDNERLSEFCYDDLVNTSVHEGYPGHHLQLVCSNLNPSLARIFSHASEFVEGWAHYCEDAAAEAGFKNTPQSTLIRYKDMLWRAWRIIIDIKLSTGTMSFDEAIKTLVEKVGMNEVGALAEVKRYTYTPTYQLSYLIGKHLLKALKEKVKGSFPREFTDKTFHDILLNAGSLPIGLMRKVLDEKMREASSSVSPR
jgi:uncharacterized protein (DUF885 family)